MYYIVILTYTDKRLRNRDKFRMHEPYKKRGFLCFTALEMLLKN